MEITSTGAAYLDNYRLSSSKPVYSPENFQEILQKTQAKKTTEDASLKNTSASSIDKNDQLYQLCLELETFLVKNLINGMRNTVQKTGLVDDSFAGKIYEDMLYDEYAKEFTKSAGFGLAEQAYRQLRQYY